MLKYREILLEKYPEMVKWMPEEYFRLDPIWNDAITINIWDRDSNNAGAFLAANLDTPTTVMKGCATPERILTELELGEDQGFPYTHVGFSIFVEAYSEFVKCARTVKKFNKEIITIAGNVGCLFEGTQNHVDLVCRPEIDEQGNVISGTGDGVLFLRTLFGEDINKPHQFIIIPSKQTYSFLGTSQTIGMAQLTTKLGCPMDCDFCVTRALFQGKCSPPMFTPQQVHSALVEYREKVKEDFIVMFCEPTAITTKKWWYKLFELFNDEPYDYSIQLLTTGISFDTFDLDRISDSSLRFGVVNVGVESFKKHYTKNQRHKNTKNILKRLNDYGIGVLASFIIGFDHHTHKNVKTEVKKLVNLEAMNHIILNLKPLPYTSTWMDLRQQGRLLDIPEDFFYIDYFQSFTHPHFKPGFEDMIPLFHDIHTYI
jgi:hypothetical protein